MTLYVNNLEYIRFHIALQMVFGQFYQIIRNYQVVVQILLLYFHIKKVGKTVLMDGLLILQMILIG